MAQQTIALPSAWFLSGAFDGGFKQWTAPLGSSRPLIDDALSVASGTAFIRLIVFANGRVQILLGVASGDASRDLTPAVEMNGVFTLRVGTTGVDFGILGADVSEPYQWLPTNASDIIAFYRAIGTTAVAATFILRDGPANHLPLIVGKKVAGAYIGGKKVAGGIIATKVAFRG